MTYNVWKLAAAWLNNKRNMNEYPTLLKEDCCHRCRTRSRPPPWTSFQSFTISSGTSNVPSQRGVSNRRSTLTSLVSPLWGTWLQSQSMGWAVAGPVCKRSDYLYMLDFQSKGAGSDLSGWPPWETFAFSGSVPPGDPDSWKKKRLPCIHTQVVLLYHRLPPGLRVKLNNAK